MILLPADHVIRPARVFQEVLAAAERAQTGVLVTLGVTPTCPATGYGYIHAGEATATNFCKVLEFKEKLNKKTAKQFFCDGSYKWNSGMFIWRVESIIKAFSEHVPELAEKIQHWSATGEFESDFASCPKISIDYAIMEKADNVEVGDASFDWNDIGSWSSLRSVLPLDDNGNALRGNVVTLDSANNVLICGARRDRNARYRGGEVRQRHPGLPALRGAASQGAGRSPEKRFSNLFIVQREDE